MKLKPLPELEYIRGKLFDMKTNQIVEDGVFIRNGNDIFRLKNGLDHSESRPAKEVTFPWLNNSNKKYYVICGFEVKR